MGDAATEWYFDLERGIAVPADQRGNADHTLGPYGSKAEAEDWKATVEARNEVWDRADEEWNAWGDDASEDE